MVGKQDARTGEDHHTTLVVVHILYLDPPTYLELSCVVQYHNLADGPASETQ